jgi:hypothetical protein
MPLLGLATRSRAGRLLLLAPSADRVPAGFASVDVSPDRYERVLTQVQRLRGSVYLKDGAIERRQLTYDGRHVQDVDQASWHVVSMLPDGRIVGCARYREHGQQVKPEDLGVWRSALARHAMWQPWLRMAVENEIDLARRRDVAYAEVGGWAIAEDLRFTPEAVDVALSTFALAESLGGSLGITTATVRNCSSRILRKLGGRSLEVAGCLLPSYYDPQYRCEMEILRFDSSEPNPKYSAQIALTAQRFRALPVLCAKPAAFEAPAQFPFGAGLRPVPGFAQPAFA